MNWLTTTAPDWSQTLTFLLDSALKGSVVIAIAAVAAWLLRRHTAAARHSVWSAAIAAQLVIPVLSAVLPTWRVPVVPRPAWVAPDVPPVLALPNDASTTTPSKPAVTEQATGNRLENSPATAPQARTAAPTSRWNFTPAQILAALWLLGFVAVLVRLAAGTAVVSRMAVRGHRVTDEKWLGLLHRLAVTLGIRRPLTLLRGDALGVPVTWGIVYPIVLLPEDADSWPEERRRYVLVHEMAHVKRLDAFTQLIAQFALAIFWFNPLVWIAAQQMRRERENACDDYVITHGTRPSEYATDLLQLVQDIDTEGHRGAAPAFAALAMARRSEFEGRMLSILNPRIRRQGLTRKGVVMGLISTLIIAAPLAAFSPFSTVNPNPSTATLPDTVTFVDSNATTSPAIGSTAQAPRSGSQVTESSGSPESCDRAGDFTGTSTSIHDSSERPDSRTIRFTQRRPGRCVEASLFGVVTFSGDERDIAEMGRGASARFREVVAGADREMTIKSNGDRHSREYTVNGRSVTFDDEGRAWFGSVIQTVVRESAYNAPERVRRLEREGGANRVLAEIDAIRSPNAKRAYYEALLGLGTPLSDSTLTRILSRMKQEFAGSSSDMHSVLRKVPAQSVRTPQSRAAFTSAMASIESDGDKASLLAGQVPTADQQLLVDIMDVAKTINSDGDKARLLIIAAVSYLNPQVPQLRQAFFNVAESIESDGDLARVLITAAPYGHADAGVTEAVITATRRIESDGDAATVLVYIATQRLLTSSKVKDAYLNAARDIESEGDRTRVLRAAMINQ
jgi:beta-lactamase regulating signal transducer with metallopeptidase domain